MTTTEDLLGIRKHAREASRRAEKAAASLTKVVDDYNAARRVLFQEELKRRKLAWCTRCNEMVNVAETKLLLLEGVGEESCGYQNSSYTFRSFSELHCACPKCYQAALNRHGWVGEYNSSLRAQPKFYAFLIEEREEGIFASKFGEWVKLSPNYKVPEIWEHMIECLCTEWNLPPKLEIKWGRLIDPEWIVAGEPA